MPPIFFQKFWHIVGEDVSQAISDFLVSGHILREINFTRVVLVPKVKNPQDMAQAYVMCYSRLILRCWQTDLKDSFLLSFVLRKVHLFPVG